jgi:hypothetical protein
VLAKLRCFLGVRFLQLRYRVRLFFVVHNLPFARMLSGCGGVLTPNV